MATVKRYFPGGSTVAMSADGSVQNVERYLVTDLDAGTSELERKLAAIAATGKGIGDEPDGVPVTPVYFVYLQRAEAELLSDSSAVVTLVYGPNVDPPIDGGWIAEASGAALIELRGVDAVGTITTVKYLPDGKAEPGFWNDVAASWKFNRSVPVPSFVTIVNLALRRHVSYSKMVEFGATNFPLRKWPTLLQNYANAEIASGGKTVPAGVWRCAGVDIATRNGGQSYLVTAGFAYRSDGWEQYLLFTHPDTGAAPADIDIPAGMKSPWPTVRASSSAPYGASRPQTLRGTMSFLQSPLDIDLAVYSPLE